MKESDKERLKKIVSTWKSLDKQLKERNITREIFSLHAWTDDSPRLPNLWYCLILNYTFLNIGSFSHIRQWQILPQNLL